MLEAPLGFQNRCSQCVSNIHQPPHCSTWPHKCGGPWESPMGPAELLRGLLSPGPQTPGHTMRLTFGADSGAASCHSAS